jgi:hypothetical protein
MIKHIKLLNVPGVKKLGDFIINQDLSNIKDNHIGDILIRNLYVMIDRYDLLCELLPPTCIIYDYYDKKKPYDNYWFDYINNKIDANNIYPIQLLLGSKIEINSVVVYISVDKTIDFKSANIVYHFYQVPTIKALILFKL